MHPIHADRLGDVLDLLIAEIVERQRQLVADVIAGCRRDADRARLSEAFQPGRDVDPVAEQVPAVDHDIADMHADAELHRLVCGAARILRGDRGLHRDRALHRIDRARKVGDDAVAGGVEDAAPVRRDQPIDDGAARPKSREGADLVARHQPAVAGNVGGKDRRKFALYRMDGHAWLLPIRV